MTKTICRRNNLTFLIDHPDFKPFLGALASSLSRMRQSHRGTLAHDVLPLNLGGPPLATKKRTTSRLDDDLLNALAEHLNARGTQQYIPYYPKQSSRATSVKGPDQLYLHAEAELIDKISLNGVEYHCVNSSLGASHIVVRVSSGNGTDVEVRQPAQIRQILRHSRHTGDSVQEAVFLLVAYLQPLVDFAAERDPYRKFPGFGCLWKNEFDSQLSLIDPSQAVCHFARTEMTLEEVSSLPLYHALPLDQVCVAYTL